MTNCRVATIVALTLAASAAFTMPAFAAPAPVPSPAGVSGSGTADSPYTADCDNDAIRKDFTVCTVTFPDRTVKFWDGERLGSYQCPSARPYLANIDVPPRSNLIDNGIEIRGMAPFGIQVVASAGLPTKTDPHAWWVNALKVPSGVGSGSVSNWNTDPRAYGVTLHCTNSLELAYPPK